MAKGSVKKPSLPQSDGMAGDPSRFHPLIAFHSRLSRVKHEEGLAKNALEHFLDGRIFHWIIMTLILVNATLLGLKASSAFHSAYNPLMQQISEKIVWIFGVEMLLRLFAGNIRTFRKPLDLLDLAAVSASIFFHHPEFSIIRLIRCLRVFMLHNLSRNMRHILTGMRHALPGIIHVIVLLCILFYMFAILAVALFAHPDLHRFTSIGITMKTLFQILTGDNWFSILTSVEEIFPYAWVYFFVYYVVMVFVSLNLFIGIMVNAFQLYETSHAMKEDPFEQILRQVFLLQDQVKQLRQTLKDVTKKDRP